MQRERIFIKPKLPDNKLLSRASELQAGPGGPSPLNFEFEFLLIGSTPTNLLLRPSPNGRAGLLLLRTHKTDISYQQKVPPALPQTKPHEHNGDV